jgi:MFS family permease
LPPEIAWRWMFAIGALPALLVFFLRRYVEEPAIAAATLAKQTASGERPSLWEIFHGPILKTTILASLMATGCQGGYYAITFWVPRFLTTERKLSVVSSTGYLAALIIGSFIGYLVGAWLADRIGRRNLFLIFSLGAIAVILLYTQLPLNNEILWLLGFPLGFFASGYFSGVGAFLTELYPTRLRGSGQGFATISAAASARYSRSWSARFPPKPRSPTPSRSLRCWPTACSSSPPSRCRKPAAGFCMRMRRARALSFPPPPAGEGVVVLCVHNRSFK